jgi:hypothetical protein
MTVSLRSGYVHPASQSPVSLNTGTHSANDVIVLVKTGFWESDRLLRNVLCTVSATYLY